jgi:hypothetical protein
MPLQVLVTTLRGDTITLEVDHSDSIAVVMKKFQDREGYLPYGLICNSKPLAGDKLVSDYDISDGSTLLICDRDLVSSNFSHPSVCLAPSRRRNSVSCCD